MTAKFTQEQLASWINDIKDAAKNDESFSIAWFPGTQDQPIAITAGWSPRFASNSEVADFFCISKSHPEYAMCIKIVDNKNSNTYIDYEFMDMLVDPITGEVEDTEVILEWDDSPACAAEFFTYEWERLMAAHTNLL